MISLRRKARPAAWTTNRRIDSLTLRVSRLYLAATVEEPDATDLSEA